MKALDQTRISAPADIRFVVSFPRYGRLKLEFVLEQINYEQIYKGLNSSVSIYRIFRACELVSSSNSLEPLSEVCVLMNLGCRSFSNLVVEVREGKVEE